jgi:hypothetical protein
MPEKFGYSLKVPTLRGVTAEVKKAFDKKVESLIAAELKYYAQAALTRSEFNTRMREDRDSTLQGKLVRDVPDLYREYCRENFTDLTGKFASSVYKDRYASVVVTFSGLNAPCVGVGGMWTGYQTDRSVTIDTKTGIFKSLTDFTSNTGGEVTAAVDAWYAKQGDQFFAEDHHPTVAKKPRVCDRPGNVHTESQPYTSRPCYTQSVKAGGPVAWLVLDNGITLTFLAGNGPSYATLKWTKIPQLL